MTAPEKTLDEITRERAARARVTSENEDIQRLLDRITIDPDIRFGKPNIRRVSPATILYQLAHGHSIAELCKDYEISEEEMRSFFAYAACFLNKEDVA